MHLSTCYFRTQPWAMMAKRCPVTLLLLFSSVAQIVFVQLVAESLFIFQHQVLIPLFSGRAEMQQKVFCFLGYYCSARSAQFCFRVRSANVRINELCVYFTSQHLYMRKILAKIMFLQSNQ